MTATMPCTVRESDQRILHGHPVTVLTDCAPSSYGADWCSHAVRFDTLVNRNTGASHETSAFGWEFGPKIPEGVR